MESTPGHNDVNTFEMTTKDLGYYINLVNKETSGFERNDSNWKEVLLWVKCSQTFVCERKNQSVCHFHALGNKKNLFYFLSCGGLELNLRYL